MLGGGLIGTGWAAAFASTGHDVVVLDPDPAAADRLDDCWQQARSVLAQVGRGSPNATPPRMGRAEEAAQADFLQEALPEDLALKQRALRDLAPHLAEVRAIASSSSTFTADQIAEATGLGNRLLIGHPCNPPWLMPIVEISPGSACNPQAIEAARGIYENAGKTVLTLRKPMKGHLVNRLQIALWREALHLVVSGAASLEDTERAVTEALAPRWCDIGPHSVFALSGGRQGMAGFLDALGPAFQQIFDDLGQPQLDAPTRAALLGAYETADLPPLTSLARLRDSNLPQRLAAKTPVSRK
ncbi:3-hydroxyacyl-CoA dehydrogenase NAD-binding domain-containing protein [Pukyongiella litopenaei]|uniref:3-hydroxyacyl-CoA dehydrogenase NAD-binding domain-containing protein n=1 Tax=Pukyongiella litopenaei TaxID=2605946 RepID=UPI001FCE566F|nr:3-hydroxyacyl-CoA dehydrogenase NAD-binding domain-containing protein [Pukyongiella litopenaei]